MIESELIGARNLPKDRVPYSDAPWRQQGRQQNGGMIGIDGENHMEPTTQTVGAVIKLKMVGNDPHMRSRFGSDVPRTAGGEAVYSRR